jgi:hypothetical protein
MGTLKNKVRQDAKTSRKEFRGGGKWLNDAVEFNPELSIVDESKRQAEALFDTLIEKSGYKVQQKIKDFNILLANLLKQNQRPISISLNRNDWKQSKYMPASYYTIDLINILHQNNLIKMKKGYYKQGNSKKTRIWADETLYELFPLYPKEVIYQPYQLVLLKDNKGELMDYKDTAETRRIRAILEQANKINGQADIRLEKYKLHAYLKAIFLKRFTLYGRLHTSGGRYHYQGISETDRSRIMINGDETVELDYCALHPMLLYATEKIQYFGDPYSVVDERKEIRKFLKCILLSMLNAKDQKLAERAANFYLYENHNEREILRELDIIRARPLMDKFMEIHKPISKHFCNGTETGLRIMNLDSKIALDIVHHFVRLNIPILAIHDSFIVQMQYKEELYKTMKRVYHKHTNKRIMIK